ncbi:MAG: L-seryl-tRNA(Sec) selenium transferase, partial [Chloroflexota bacterium]|nr:L-seryl-tRNA(Sec) selenium transferase [Chloroflexota bacterium]
MATTKTESQADGDLAAGRAALRRLPGVGKLLADPAIRALTEGLPREYVTRVVAGEIDAARGRLLAGGDPSESEGVRERVLARLRLLLEPKLRRVINATGVVLHTNLGRAPVSGETAAAMDEALRGYTPLELDLATGGRGGRMAEIEVLLQALTGTEAALVVNNNAAATTLVLGALAAGRGVILSRGEAVEIGGGFRVPDVMRESGAALVEVGTTNRTYARDYEAAIGEGTAALLKVHASNFRIVGFTHETTIAELAEVGRRRGLPLIHDLGSGALRDTAEFGLGHEPTVGASVRDGAAVTLFSGDKLLGGPQAGVIVGERGYVARIARHPLARAVRADKATLAGVAATLRHYLRGEELRAIPVWRMIAASEEGLRDRAEALRAALAERGIAAVVVPARST